jgi:hypothetical protein
MKNKCPIWLQFALLTLKPFAQVDRSAIAGYGGALMTRIL